MKVFAREFGHDYARYRFGYCQYAELDDLKEAPEAYARGYLPYSGDPNDPRHLFYMARSLRVPMEGFVFDKKRRYLQRRFASGTGVTFAVQAKEAFLASEAETLAADAQAWLDQRFGQSYMDPVRLRYILGKPWLDTVMVACAEGRTIAYALVCRWEVGAHFWFSFYDPGFRAELSPGLWLMGRAMEWARDEGLAHIYLGTVYAPSSAYKFQGVHACEFWDGASWNRDRDLLRASLGD